jgi:hypothetical protein
MGEVVGVEADRFAVLLFGIGNASLLFQRIAAQRMEDRFARLQFDRLVGLGQRLRRILRQQLAAFVVGGIGRLALDQEGDLLPVSILAAIQVRRQRGRLPAIGVDAFLRGRMRGKHAGQPVRRFVARQADEGFLQFHRGFRVVAGAHHVVDAVVVGLQFVFAAEAQPDQRRPALRGEVHQAGVLAVGGQRADQRPRRPPAACPARPTSRHAGRRHGRLHATAPPPVPPRSSVP